MSEHISRPPSDASQESISPPAKYLFITSGLCTVAAYAGEAIHMPEVKWSTGIAAVLSFMGGAAIEMYKSRH